MDLLDRIQSGLFFHQLAPIDSGSSLAQTNIPPRPQPGLTPAYQAVIPPPPAPRIVDAPASSPPVYASTIPLPLLSVAVDVDANGRLCTTKITQRFSNASPDIAQHAKYVFPVYDGSVVTEFRCWVGTTLLEGAVKARETAQAEFKQAVSQYKAAVLVEELTPEVFETNVGNIPAHTTVKVEISYASLLKVDSSTGGLVLTIPTSIAPRYGIPPMGYTSNQSLSTDGLKINVNASMPAAIRKMESRSHPISVEIGAVTHSSFETFAAGASSEKFDPTRGRATLSDRQAILDRDFVLFILSKSRELAKSRAIAEPQPGTSGLFTVAITIHPGDLFLENVDTGEFDGEIIFMVDRSGSMQDTMPSLINVLNIFLRSLPRNCSFNIASFGSSVSWMWPTSQKYSQQALDLASDQIESFQADLGGTEIYSALDSVKTHHNSAREVASNVILLTDGEVWDVDNVIELVRSMTSDPESNLRFFFIGIGDHVSHRLVEGIGEQGGGYAEVITESSTGSWQERIIQMLKAALTPSRLRCEVHFGETSPADVCEKQVAGITVKCPRYLQAPYSIPTLNTFSHCSVYYTLDERLAELPAAVNIIAITDKGEKLITHLPLEQTTERTAIHHLAAKALMDDYETGHSWLHLCNPRLMSESPAALEQILKEEAQALGQQWSITSSWTSYVAIDSSTRQQHEISVLKAKAVEIMQLTEPRPTAFSNFHPNMPMPQFSPLSPQLYIPPQSFGQDAGGFDNSSEDVRIFHFGDLRRYDDSLSNGIGTRSANWNAGTTPSKHNSTSGYFIDPTSALSDWGEEREDTLRSQPFCTTGHQRSIAYTPGVDDIPFLEVPPSASVDPVGVPITECDSPQISPPVPLLTSSTCASSDIFRRPHAPLAVKLEVESWPVREARPPDRKRLSLDNLLHTQDADGKFHSHGPELEESMIPDGKAEFLAQFLDSVFKDMPATPEQDLDVERYSVRFNILAILYVIDVHASSKGLWELQVSKAWQWLGRTVARLWARKGCSGDMPLMSLERLESSLIIGQLVNCAGAFDSARPKDVS